MRETRTCTGVNELDENPDHGFVKTHESLDPQYHDRLDENINEYYLFHGTSPAGAMGITRKGFKLSLSGSAAPADRAAGASL